VLYHRPQHIVIQAVGFEDDVMVYDTQNGMMHIVNTTASTVLTLLNEPKSIEEVVEVLVSEYDVTSDVAHAELKLLLSELEQHRLIEHVNQRRDT